MLKRSLFHLQTLRLSTQNERISSFDCGLFFRMESSWAEESQKGRMQ